MQLALELLAPARDLAIGTAAIDCGADAVYIAGPAFGARVAASNPVEDIAQLCNYAHLYGVRVYATLNTLLEESELQQAEALAWQYYDAGVDALIVQDMNVLSLNLPPIELHASTQSVVRTPERAAALEKAGFTRIILERQLSMQQIRSIREAVSCDLEFFVHGALCVCYSGQCYLSEYLTGRSANRGCCAQPCRSRYNLVDAGGKVILRDRPILSLKDYRLDSRIPSLVESGISSFKIEGRLKNASYVKNIVRHYSEELDRFIAANPQYRRASFGRTAGGFSPNPDATFNRGYTEAWIDGKRGRWNSGDAAKALGEHVGDIAAIRGGVITLNMAKGVHIVNGDGLSIVSRGEEVCGMRAEVVNGRDVTVRDASGLHTGDKVYRSLNLKFERELEKNMPKRMMKASVSYRESGGIITLTATDEAGITVEMTVDSNAGKAEKAELAEENIRRNLGKTAFPFSFTVESIEADNLCFHPASQLNAWRRQLGVMLSKESRRPACKPYKAGPQAAVPENVRPLPGELMRTRYCIKWEIGACPKQKGPHLNEPLYLVNRNQKFCLHFDCKNCEMTVSLEIMRFSDVIGNNELKRTLERMVDGNRLSHAILFCEKNGGGAFPLAVSLAQYVNCTDRQQEDSCGVCPSCHKYGKLIHPDLHFVFPVSATKDLSESEKKAPVSDYFLPDFRALALQHPYFGEQELYDAIGMDAKSGSINVAESRRIFEKLSLKAGEGLYKVMIVFLPEKMNQDAANKLLKLLEEPPQQTLFLLITHAPEKILPTIRSRCLRIDLKPLDKDEKARSETACDSSGVRDLTVSILEAAADKNLAEIFPLWETVAEMGREKQKEFCLSSEDILRKIFLLSKGVDSLAMPLDMEENAARRLAEKLNPEFYEKALSAFDQALSSVEGNVNARLNFCNLCNCLVQAS